MFNELGTLVPATNPDRQLPILVRIPSGHSVDEHVHPSDATARYRGTSLIRRKKLLGPYSKTIPMVLRRSRGGVLFFMSKVPLTPWQLEKQGEVALCEKKY